jgi:hypothetical protein
VTKLARQLATRRTSERLHCVVRVEGKSPCGRCDRYSQWNSMSSRTRKQNVSRESDWIEVAVTKYLSDEDLQPVSGSKAEPATSGKMALAARTEGKWLHSHGSRVAWTLERADSSQVRVKLYHFFVQGGRHESPVYFLYMLH